MNICLGTTFRIGKPNSLLPVSIYAPKCSSFQSRINLFSQGDLSSNKSPCIWNPLIRHRFRIGELTFGSTDSTEFTGMETLHCACLQRVEGKNLCPHMELHNPLTWLGRAGTFPPTCSGILTSPYVATVRPPSMRPQPAMSTEAVPADGVSTLSMATLSSSGSTLSLVQGTAVLASRLRHSRPLPRRAIDDVEWKQSIFDAVSDGWEWKWKRRRHLFSRTCCVVKAKKSSNVLGARFSSNFLDVSTACIPLTSKKRH
jgi:hypothetical protein